jgi:hypothetical protein
MQENGDIYEGICKNDQLSGEGVLFKPRENSFFYGYF